MTGYVPAVYCLSESRYDMMCACMGCMAGWEEATCVCMCCEGGRQRTMPSQTLLLYILRQQANPADERGRCTSAHRRTLSAAGGIQPGYRRCALIEGADTYCTHTRPPNNSGWPSRVRCPSFHRRRRHAHSVEQYAHLPSRSVHPSVHFVRVEFNCARSAASSTGVFAQAHHIKMVRKPKPHDIVVCIQGRRG